MNPHTRPARDTSPRTGPAGCGPAPRRCRRHTERCGSALGVGSGLFPLRQTSRSHISRAKIKASKGRSVAEELRHFCPARPQLRETLPRSPRPGIPALPLGTDPAARPGFAHVRLGLVLCKRKGNPSRLQPSAGRSPILSTPTSQHALRPVPGGRAALRLHSCAAAKCTSQGGRWGSGALARATQQICGRARLSLRSTVPCSGAEGLSGLPSPALKLPEPHPGLLPPGSLFGGSYPGSRLPQFCHL